MEIKIILSDEQVNCLERVFRRCKFDDQNQIAEEVSKLAVQSWLDWLDGRKRYRSLTEQYTDWLEFIYSSILPEDEPPSVDRLYNSFNIPYGQAQYISRVLNNKSLTLWRNRAKQEIRNCMEEKMEEVGGWINDDRATSEAQIILSQVAFFELKGVWERLYKQNRDTFILPHYQSAGNFYNVWITALCFKTIYDAIE